VICCCRSLHRLYSFPSRTDSPVRFGQARRAALPSRRASGRPNGYEAERTEAKMTTLALHFIGPNDFVVVDDGYPIGRIRRTTERRGEVWYWNVTIPVPGVPGGTAFSLEVARATFRKAWTKTKAEIGPERLASALELAQAARERLNGK
jgi:hypothetical protein